MAILGIDEVGRGPLAGPLVVGAVILPERNAPTELDAALSEGGSVGALANGIKEADSLAWISELKDSKKLTPKKREKYSEIILKEALATGLGWVGAREIDEIGIAEALRLAVRRAVEEVQKQKVAFSEIIIDGKINFLAKTRLSPFVTTLVKADDLIKEVSAASIIAKVARDRYMIELASQYPGYAFEKNMGYGTAAHLKALFEIGPCPEHRRSFEPLKSKLGDEAENSAVVVARTLTSPRVALVPTEIAPSSTGKDLTKSQRCAIMEGKNGFCRPQKSKLTKNTTLIGGRGENAVAEYLVRQGHKIAAQNFKTKTCEIDLVSVLGDQIYFTEVKYRRTDRAGSGFEAITKEKLRQMEYAAKVFIAMHPEFRELSPLLAAAAVSGEDYAVLDWVKIA